MLISFHPGRVNYNQIFMVISHSNNVTLKTLVRGRVQLHTNERGLRWLIKLFKWDLNKTMVMSVDHLDSRALHICRWIPVLDFVHHCPFGLHIDRYHHRPTLLLASLPSASKLASNELCRWVLKAYSVFSSSPCHMSDTCILDNLYFFSNKYSF